MTRLLIAVVISFGLGILFHSALYLDPTTAPPPRQYELPIYLPTTPMDKPIITLPSQEGPDFNIAIWGVYGTDTLLIARASMIFTDPQKQGDPIGTLRIEAPAVLVVDGWAWDGEDEETEVNR